MAPNTRTYEELLAELEQAKAELAARPGVARAQAILQGVLDSAVNGIFAADAVRDAQGQVVDFRFTLVNPTCEKMLLHSADQLVGRTLLELFPGVTENGLFDAYKRVTATGVATEVISYYRDAQLDFWLSVSVVRLEDGVAVTFTDITQQKRADAEAARREQNLQAANEELAAQAEELMSMGELRRIDAMKNEFLGILSHELRTPINAMMGFGSILDDELVGPLNPEQRRYMGKILDASEALLALVQDLLDMSRIQAGKFTIVRGPVALPRLVEDVIANMGFAAGTKHIALHAAVPPGLPPLWADEQRLAQVLSNLVGNAVKFTQAGGRVELSAEVVGDSVQVAVADNGPGIAIADQAKLFNAFTQLDMSNTRKAGGVGLGLATCKNLIEAHGGQVGLRSATGHGATFWFTLPLDARA